MTFGAAIFFLLARRFHYREICAALTVYEETVSFGAALTVCEETVSFGTALTVCEETVSFAEPKEKTSPTDKARNVFREKNPCAKR